MHAQPLLAQKLSTNLKSGLKRADEFYERFDYPKALEEYRYQYDKVKRKEGLEKEAARIALKVADCYRKMNLSEKTLEWYAMADQQRVLDTFDFLNYAEMLAQERQYKKAKAYYQQFKDLNPDDSRAHFKLQAVSNLGQFYKDSSRFKIINAPFNTKVSDFGPAFYEEGIVYVSEYNRKFMTKNEHNWHGKDFLMFYYTENQDSSRSLEFSGMKFKQPRPFNTDINTKYHEGPSVFYNNEEDFVFTRNNYHKGKVGQSENNTIKLKLFHADKKGDGWANIEPMPFNNDEYSVGHPAISSDGLTLYFASDMPGGIGKVDLYKVTRSSLDSPWGTPENLGRPINTEGDELFPFFFQDSVLYFASNGHAGLGGLDIMQSTMVYGKFTKPQNMGYPLNTSKDDFGLILRDDYSGFFASNRPGGQGDDDIFVVLVKKRLLVPVKGRLMSFNYSKNDSTDLHNGLVTVVNKNDTSDKRVLQTDELGRFYFQSEPGQSYVVMGGKDSLIAEKQELTVPDEAEVKKNPGPIKVDLLAKEGDDGKVPMEGTFRHIRAGDTATVANAQIILVNKDDPEDKQYLTTDDKGQFRFRATPGQNYVVKGEHEKGKHKDEQLLTVPNERPKDNKPMAVVLETGEGASEPIALSLQVFTQNDQLKNKSRDSKLYYYDSEEKSAHSFRPKGGNFDMELTQGATYYFAVQQQGYDKACLKVMVAPDAEPQKLTGELVMPQLLAANSAEFVIDNLYYDFDKSYIRKDAAKELDKLIDLMKRYPKTKVDLRSHTDCRGIDTYNEGLAQRRAEAAVAYLIKHGIDRKRLTAKGFGEYKLTNKCDDGVPCSAAQHQANRRTEVKLTKVPASETASSQPEPLPAADEVFEDLTNFSDCQTLEVK